MGSFARAQADLYAALRGFGPCFLRVSAGQDALWVSDLPRWIADVAPAEAALPKLEVRRELDAPALLWKLDWIPERYEALAKTLPSAPPPFPAAPTLEEAYALCRLLLLHPSPVSEQPMAMVREVLKLESAFPAGQPATLRRLHGQCAARLRRGEPLPTLAGSLLSDWINRLERGMNI